MQTHILAYLLMASAVFFLEVIFPFGLLGLMALGLYAIAVYKAWVMWGVMGGLTTLLLALAFALFTAYWELRMLPKTRWGRIRFIKERMSNKLAQPSAQLRGMSGTVKSTMSPTSPYGHVEVARKLYQAESLSGTLAEGENVRVVDVGIRGVKVEKI